MDQGLTSILKNPQTKSEKLARWLVWTLVVGGILSMSWDFYGKFTAALRGKIEDRSWSSILTEINCLVGTIALVLFFSKRPWRRFAMPLLYLWNAGWLVRFLWPTSGETHGAWSSLVFATLTMISIAAFVVAGLPPPYYPKWRVSRRLWVITGAGLFILSISLVYVMGEAESKARAAERRQAHATQTHGP